MHQFIVALYHASAGLRLREAEQERAGVVYMMRTRHSPRPRNEAKYVRREATAFEERLEDVRNESVWLTQATASLQCTCMSPLSSHMEAAIVQQKYYVLGEHLMVRTNSGSYSEHHWTILLSSTLRPGPWPLVWLTPSRLAACRCLFICLHLQFCLALFLSLLSPRVDFSN